MAAALQGVTVLDLSRILAGPWSTQNLADLGADVIKVERPGAGDDTRGWGPPFVTRTDAPADASGPDARDAAYYFCANRGKRSITLDFTKPEGREVLLKLVAKADVLVENYKVGGLKKYGLDYATLAAVNPSLIYCSITGFGHSGPYAERPGYDALIQAMGGLMSITGEPDGTPGGGPQKVGVAVVDILTALYATSAILAALYHRTRTGEGQHIDVALLDVQVATLANQASNYLLGDVVPGRLGSAHPSIVPYQPFACADGYVMLAIGNDTQFANFCDTAGMAELAKDERFATNAARVRSRNELVPLLQQRMLAKTIDEWCTLGNQRNFPCGPINTIDRVFEDPQVQARSMRQQVQSDHYGTVDLVANPMKLSGTPTVEPVAPPALGVHTEDVLAELGLDAQSVAALRAKGVL
ncbi:CoA transferase [Pusillimonas sp. CC-YST705]|uniref:CoA transferase n=1 Tax=Mesopusillimonas faecipullorum TaxID=2755040 RepID=A0ABS8CE34_9BURK|nr:CaiB/BaiF CoA-transferase family protein [Mesopusillimonas faecipullorum]MCB5364301.1 CoA transferase [Mesopusillimonas faecipullorum]